MDLLDTLKAIIESELTCTVITQGRDGNLRARTMSRLSSLDRGHIDFPTTVTSNKVEDIRADARVTLFFIDPRTRDTAVIYGTGEIVTDGEEKRLAWTDRLRHRWPDGHTDPTFVVFRVHLLSGEYLIAETESCGKVTSFSGS